MRIASIILIADTYDALKNSHPYKNDWSVDAVDEVENIEGTDLGFRLVDASIEIILEMPKIRKQYSDGNMNDLSI